MLNSDFLDIAIGMVFVYFLLSLLSVTIAELIARILALRSGTLVDAIRNLLADSALNEEFWNHPLIKKLAQDKGWGMGQGNRKASYIPANLFVLALLDVIDRKVRPSGSRRTPDDVQRAVESLADDQLRKLITALIGGGGDLEEIQQNLATWFDQYMERVSGWYKRKSQTINLVLGLALAVTLNIDSLAIFSALSTNPGLRAAVVEVATNYVNDQSPPIETATQPITGTQASSLGDSVAEILKLEGTLAKLNLPLTWAPADEKIPIDLTGWFNKVLGLLVTALLVSLGAPFWFDLLSKFVTLRSTGKVPETPKENPSDDNNTSSHNNTTKPLDDKPPPPSGDLTILANKAVQFVEASKGSGWLKDRDDEDGAAVQFMRSYATREGWDFTDAQLFAAWRAASEQQKNA